MRKAGIATGSYDGRIGHIEGPVMHRPLSVVALLVAVVCGGHTTTALAWGTEGHALIADIAALRLTPAARRGVQRLLSREDHKTLESIASWADARRHDRPGTGKWHYVDIPIGAQGYRASRDCPRGACVVHKLAHFAGQLSDPDTSAARRLRALKYVVHFAGDIQQPLHASDNDDKGGNEVTLTYFGRHTNLHQIWDSRILEQALGLHMRAHYEYDHAAVRRQARRLLDDTTAAERQRWADSIDDGDLTPTAIRWANQAHRIAVQVAYGQLPDNRHEHWDRRYQTIGWRAVRRQLQRGGIRLAAVLNAAFD